MNSSAFKKKKKNNPHEIAEYAEQRVVSVTSHSHFVNPMDRGVPETYSRIMNVKKIPPQKFNFCTLFIYFFSAGCFLSTIHSASLLLLFFQT